MSGQVQMIWMGWFFGVSV